MSFRYDFLRRFTQYAKNCFSLLSKIEVITTFTLSRGKTVAHKYDAQVLPLQWNLICQKSLYHKLQTVCQSFDQEQPAPSHSNCTNDDKGLMFYEKRHRNCLTTKVSLG